MSRGPGLVTLMLTAVAILAGCDADIGKSINARNDTQLELHFVAVTVDGASLPVGPKRLAPGVTVSLQGGPGIGGDDRIVVHECFAGDVIALDAQDHEVARRHPPFCVGQTWIVALATISPT